MPIQLFQEKLALIKVIAEEQKKMTTLRTGSHENKNTENDLHLLRQLQSLQLISSAAYHQDASFTLSLREVIQALESLHALS
jgi:hypothetical protein